MFYLKMNFFKHQWEAQKHVELKANVPWKHSAAYSFVSYIVAGGISGLLA